jgi:glutaminyl-peptide cyclotransferase
MAIRHPQRLPPAGALLRSVTVGFGLTLIACNSQGRSEAAPASRAADSLPSAQSTTAPVPFDATAAWRHLDRLVGFGPRPSGSAALGAARAYIIETVRSYGLRVEEQRFVASTPAGRVDMVNIIATVPGRRTDRILFTGHYDTKPLRDVRFVGASDGGSSAAWLVEMARVLARRPGEFTYELVWFDGEEAVCREWTECGTPSAPDNTYGSRHYVTSARTTQTLAGAKALILVDMIGARDLKLRRDALSTSWLTDLIWSTAKDMGAGQVFLEATTPIEDDHVPFLAAGVPSVDLIDLIDYPYWHTPEDTLDKLEARSLKVVGDVVLAALPKIEAYLTR